MSGSQPFKAVADAMAAKRVTDKCPMCGTERWGLLSTSDGENQFPVVNTAPKAYLLTCLNCGFVRTHIAAVLEGQEPEAP
ncbi:MAG: hypothetical protein K2X11_06865 [Acetobacteraceae bacterium]|nr:hypothetical protein [Acetobacteraceae bacterium]